jgi:hypothetical protein
MNNIQTIEKMSRLVSVRKDLFKPYDEYRWEVKLDEYTGIEEEYVRTSRRVPFLKMNKERRARILRGI